jgi:hypothetical protein
MGRPTLKDPISVDFVGNQSAQVVRGIHGIRGSHEIPRSLTIRLVSLALYFQEVANGLPIATTRLSQGELTGS